MAKPKKPSNAERVEEFFAELRLAVPGTPQTLGWLADLQGSALAKSPGWAVEAESYLQGLAAAGAISADAAASCRQRLAQCVWSSPTALEILAPLAWIAVVAATTLNARAIASDTLAKAGLWLLAFAAGCLWTATRPWMQQRNNSGQARWVHRIFIAIIAVAVSIVVAPVTNLVGLGMQQLSLRQFKVERDAFLADPQGFPVLHKLAREQYGVEVVLGDAEESWASTTVDLPNSSVALMNLGPGYCHLSLSRSSVMRRFGPVPGVAPALWVQGVMLHELAHCLDISRDTPAYGERAVTTRSIAPVDAGGLQTIEGFVEAHARPATQLWREAVADIMTVGFWRLAAPGAASDLTANLRRHRAEAVHDKEHATMCWIDFASQAAAPSSTAALFAWADRLRSQAPCALPQRQDKIVGHAVQGAPQR